MLTSLIAIYLLLGVLFALAFLFLGYRKIDPSAESAGFGVRLMWMPAALALWPIVAFRWFSANNNQD
jgi:hypothetical protein